jgi:flagellin
MARYFPREAPMVSSINSYFYNLADIYHQNRQNLAQTLTRLASGKKFQTPSDDLSGYFRSETLQQQYDRYQQIRPDMEEWKGVMDIASTAGQEVYSTLDRMKELSDLSADLPTTDSKQADYTAEYNHLLSNLTKTRATTFYGSTDLLNTASGGTPPMKVIDLIPDAAADNSQSMVIDPGKIISDADLGSLAIPAAGTVSDVASDIDTALADVQTFLGTVSAYSSGLQSHLNITDSIMSNLQGAKSAVTDVDTAQEMMTYTQQDILSQASMAMIAQANMSQRSILFLYGMK